MKLFSALFSCSIPSYTRLLYESFRSSSRFTLPELLALWSPKVHPKKLRLPYHPVLHLRRLHQDKDCGFDLVFSEAGLLSSLHIQPSFWTLVLLGKDLR